MRVRRPNIEAEQANVRIAIDLINELIKLNKDIDINIFISAMANMLVIYYLVNDHSKRELLNDMNEVAVNWEDDWRKK